MTENGKRSDKWFLKRSKEAFYPVYFLSILNAWDHSASYDALKVSGLELIVLKAVERYPDGLRQRR